VKALEDFAAGPEAALGDPIGKHDEVKRLARELGPRSAELRIEPTPQMAQLPISLRKSVKVARLLTLNGHLVPWKPEPRERHRFAVFAYHHRWDTVDGASIAVKVPWQHGFAVFDRDPARFWQLGRRAAVMSARLLTAYPKMCRMWRERLPELTSMAYWRRYLGLPAIEPAQASASESVRASSA
jgi:hypothetical protein